MATKTQVPGNRTDSGAAQGVLYALVIELPSGELEYREVPLRPGVLPGDWVFQVFGPGTIYFSEPVFGSR